MDRAIGQRADEAKARDRSKLQGRWVRVSVYLLALTLPFQEAKPPRFGVQTADEVQSGGPLFLLEYALILMTLAAILSVGGRLAISEGARRARSVAFLMTGWAIVVLLGVAILELPVADGSWGNVRMLAWGAISFIAVLSVPWPAAAVTRVAGAFVCAMVLHAMVLWIDFTSPGSLPIKTVVFSGGGEPRLSGLFLQPSRAGFMLAMALVLALALAGDRGLRPAKRMFFVACVPVLGGAILLTQTRGVILAAAIGGAHLLWRAKRYGWLFIAVALGTAVALSSVVSQSDVIRLGVERFSSGTEVSGTSRSDVYAQSWEYMQAFPLGGGAGGLYAFSRTFEIPHAHNMYLQVAVMFGFPGLFLFLYWTWLVLRVGRTERYLEKGAALLVGLRSTVVVGLVAFMTEPYLITNVGPWFCVFAALTVALAAPAIAAPVDSGATAQSILAQPVRTKGGVMKRPGLTSTAFDGAGSSTSEGPQALAEQRDS